MDKPQGLTSQDVVSVVRRAAGTKRVGHTGTLDPLATGLLVLLLGEATKLSEYLTGFDKVYEGSMQLGVVSNTYDVQGDIVPGPGTPIPTHTKLQALTAPLTGDILQIPPPYSAVKIAGKKLYEYARAGEEVKADPRPVTVDSFEILSVEGDRARFRIACSSGTYVRSLVHDLGQAAGCGAVVESLRRTSVGDFKLDEAHTLDAISSAGQEGMPELVLPMVDAMVDWSIYYVNEAMAEWLRRGQAIPAIMTDQDGASAAARMNDLVYLCPSEGDALAVARVVPAPPGSPPAAFKRASGFWFQPVKLLVTAEGSGDS